MKLTYSAMTNLSYILSQNVAHRKRINCIFGDIVMFLFLQGCDMFTAQPTKIFTWQQETNQSCAFWLYVINHFNDGDYYYDNYH